MPRAQRNFIIGFLVIHILATLIMVATLTRSVRRIMIDNAREQMNAMAIMLEEHAAELDDDLENERLLRYLKDLGEKTQFRFTVIDNNGRVIADSETGDRDIGPHGNRPEIRTSSLENAGFSERFSDTLKIPMMYLATPYLTDQNVMAGHVRVATPAVPINGTIRATQSYFWTFAVILSLSAGLLMAVFASVMLRPLRLFAEVARKIGVGQYEAFPALLNRSDEWRTLAVAFRTMQTELASREQRVMKHRDRLQTVLSSMVEGVISVSPEGGVLIANHAACRMLDVEEAEFRGRKLLEVVRDPELAKAIEKTQSKHTFSKVEFETAHDLDRRTISARVSVLPQPEQNDQNPPGFLAILNDITELRQLETMRRDFVANVSHELKTPLASIKAYAETLRLGAINDKQKNIKFVKEIEKQAEVLHQQILDLLQIARIESGKEVWDIEPVDINRQCEQVVARFSKLAEDSNLTIETNLSDEFPQARADVEGLATILNNLVTNSLNYTPAGGKITVSTHYRGNSAIAEIADTGIGIEAEHQTRIFERFYRVDKARSRDNGGTGLGLAIVKHLAQSFGGSVELESEIGKGTRIRIRLPKFVT